MRTRGGVFLIVAGVLMAAFGVFAIVSGILNFAAVWVLRDALNSANLTYGTPAHMAFSWFSFISWIVCGVVYLAVGIIGVILHGNLRRARMLMFLGILALYVYALSAFVLGNFDLRSLGAMVLLLLIPACFIAGARRNQSSVAINDWGYIFISPFVLIFLAFIAYPIYNTFSMSTTDARIMGGRWIINPVGMDNFQELLGFSNLAEFGEIFRNFFYHLFSHGDVYVHNMFHQAVLNTWILWLLNFVPQMILALVLAAMFTSTTYKLKGTNFFKAMYFLPNLMMPVTIASLFYSYLAVHGPVNQFMVGTLGIWDEARNFTSYVTDTRIVVIFLQTWMWFGQTAIVFVAGMTAISPTFYESAMIDGANQFKMFFRITLPLLKPIMLFVLVTSLVGGLGMFDIPLLFSQSPFGNPQNSVLTINMFMNVRRSFPSMMFGSAAAVSVLLFLMSSVVALFIFWAFRTQTDEDLAKREAKKAAKAAKLQNKGASA
ncbi:MAG: sugar ABC transporter permease [Defluviitaleaceae bacterium]|nr:sugar ABC transporter permease [Defluviitaleaceae bacterium]